MEKQRKHKRDFLEEIWDSRRTFLFISQRRSAWKESIMSSFLAVQTLRALFKLAEERIWTPQIWSHPKQNQNRDNQI